MLYTIFAVVIALFLIVDHATEAHAERNHQPRPWTPGDAAWKPQRPSTIKKAAQRVRKALQRARRPYHNKYIFLPYAEPRNGHHGPQEEPQRRRPSNPVAHSTRNPCRIW